MQMKKISIGQMNNIIAIVFILLLSILDTGTLIIQFVKIICLVYLLFYIWVNNRIYLSIYIKWILIFIIYSGSSILWSYSKTTAIIGVRTLIMNSICVCTISQLLYNNESHKKWLWYLLSIIPFIYSIKLIVLYGAYEFFNGVRSISTASMEVHNRLGLMAAFGIGFSILGIKHTTGFKMFPKFMFIFNILFLVLSGSRKAVIAATVPLIVCYVLRSKSPIKIIKNMLAGILAVIFCIVIIFNNQFLYEMVGQGLKTMMMALSGIRSVDSSTSTRMRLIQWGFEWFSEKPVIGYGLENFKKLHQFQASSVMIADNNYIELLVDLGILGIVCYYFLYIKLFYRIFIYRSKLNLELMMQFGILIAILICDYGACSYRSIYVQMLLGIICIYVQKISIVNIER